jgi:hypothetical protein
LIVLIAIGIDFNFLTKRSGARYGTLFFENFVPVHYPKNLSSITVRLCVTNLQHRLFAYYMDNKIKILKFICGL